MTSFNFTFMTNKRRGLSSIVGALLFVVLMVAAFAVLGLALDSQTDIVSTGRDVSDLDLKKNQEEFNANIYADSDEFVIVDINNDGQNPVEMATLVVTNSTQTEIHEIPSDTAFVSPGFTENVLSTTPVKLTLATSGFEIYNFKAISSLGNIKTGSIVCSTSSCEVLAGVGSLRASLFLDGPTAINTKNTTAVMFVTNTSDEELTNVQPTKGWGAPICDDLWTSDDSAQEENIVDPEDIVNCAVTPSVAQTLGPHETAIFKWDGEVLGDIGSTFEFCSSVSGDDSGGPVSIPPESCDLVTVINPNDCGGCGEGGEGGETIILIDDLLIRPTIFMIVPSPFGDQVNNLDYTGLWGINVANPTIKDMIVSKVTIVVYPPGGNSQDTVFQAEGISANNCQAEDISPNKGTQPQGYWSCPRDNILMWQSFTDPVTVPANTTKSFLARAEPYQIKTAGDNLDALIVQANVYTDFGSFGKTGYQSSMYELNAPIVNVYLTNSTNINDRDQFISHVNDITENSTDTYDVVLADLDDDPTTVINIGAKLIINVPREWIVEGLNNYAGFEDPPTVTVHSDGSTQIVGITNSVIGDGTNDARKISFDATAPDVNIERLYVMYVLADGTVTNAASELKTIGPLNEIVLNVDP